MRKQPPPPPSHVAGLKEVNRVVAARGDEPVEEDLAHCGGGREHPPPPSPLPPLPRPSSSTIASPASTSIRAVSLHPPPLLQPPPH